LVVVHQEAVKPIPLIRILEPRIIQGWHHMTRDVLTFDMIEEDKRKNKIRNIKGGRAEKEIKSS